MTTRGRMLERVRKALGRSESDPHPGSVRSRHEFPALGKVIPSIPAGELIGKFEQELKKVGGITQRAGSRSQLDEILSGILASAGEGPVVLSRNPLIARLNLQANLGAWGRSVITWRDAEHTTPAAMERFRTACFSAAAGITGAELALAESGSFVLTSETEGAQLASLAPPVHIVLYQRRQLVESLEEALQRVSAPSASVAAGRCRSIVFITGQSRTADIEQITIRGVHGPLSVHAILVEDNLAAQAGL
jgi:L-lactate dehydrogenase complex protein LldG